MGDLPNDRIASVSDTIHHDADAIMVSWEAEASSAASAHGLTRPLLRNIMPRFLDSLASSNDDLSRPAALLERHLSARIREGFELDEILEELSALGRCIASRWNDGNAPPPADIARLFATLNRSALAATAIYREHMEKDEQADKRFIRQMQAAATETPQGGRTAPLLERLGPVLEVIRSAMHADAVALLLFDASKHSLTTAASVGRGAETLERHARGIGSPALSSAVADSDDQPVEIDNVAASHLDVGDALRASGMRALVAVRLPSRHRLIGALYIGLPGAIGTRDVRRAELLGEQLTLHLYTAELSAELRATIAEMDTDRKLRDRLVSILAHDLRGPLATVRAQAQLLSRTPDLRENAATIVRSVDRTDGMVRDLLDTLLIRSGRRLPLEIEDCDLVAIARDALDELIVLHGERFVLAGDAEVRGYWSGGDLRRAIWNLSINAVKYGAPKAPIVVTVACERDGARISVHNEGPPIPVDQRARLFLPFGQLDVEPDSGRHGWGLGLTLVQGTAKAHGGSVELDSTAERGTTFTLHLPLDSRTQRTSAP